MDLIALTTITDAMVTANNVTEPSTRETSLTGWQGEWDSTTAYSANDYVMCTDTSGNGASIADHKIYQAQGSTTGDDPPTDDGSNWLEIESTDAWKLFDQIPQDQTERATQIAVDIVPGANVNSIGLINIEGSDVDIIVDDPTEGEVYNQNIDLTDNSAVIDYYEYFFEEIKQYRNFVIDGLPPYSSATITIQLNSGSTAKCGKLGIGLSANLGTSAQGAVFGILDYSTKDTDSNGRVTLTEGSYADTGTIEVKTEAGNEAGITRKLQDLRATPSIWVAKDTLTGTIIYGFAREWKYSYTDPAWSTLLLNLEGLS